MENVYNCVRNSIVCKQKNDSLALEVSKIITQECNLPLEDILKSQRREHNEVESYCITLKKMTINLILNPK